jgi:hypothetical protein
MSLKVMPKLVCTHNDYVTDFFHFGIKSLRSCWDLRHKIYWKLLLRFFAVPDNLFLDHQSSTDGRVRG